VSEQEHDRPGRENQEFQFPFSLGQLTFSVLEEHGTIPKKSFYKGRFSTCERVIRQIKEMFLRYDTPVFPERHGFPDQIFPRLPAHFAIAPISH